MGLQRDGVMSDRAATYLHIYGGLVVVGAALVTAFGWAGAAVPGAFLVYLGVWRFR